MTGNTGAATDGHTGCYADMTRRLPRWRPLGEHLWPLIVFLTALAARILHVGSVVNPIDDSRIHVLTGLFYGRDGLLYPDSWWTPPFKHLVTQGSMALLGNDLVGWRLRNVLIGAFMVYLTYCVARRLFRNEAVALAASTLLALDPFSIGLAHTTHEDIPAVCLALIGLVFFLRGLDDGREWEWVASGVAFGLGLGVRWYVLFAMLAVAAGAIFSRRHDLPRLVAATSAYTFAPASAYMAGYLPWFSRGYNVVEWIGLQRDALAIQGATFQGLPPNLAPLAGAGRWFVSWVGSGASPYLAGHTDAVSLLVNDPVIWVLFVPSALVLAVCAYREKRLSWYVVAATFFATYVFMLVSPRPIILYSAMAVVPLGFICTGFALVSLFKRRWWWLLAAGATWSLYLYPLVSAMAVWAPAYEWLLRSTAT